MSRGPRKSSDLEALDHAIGWQIMELAAPALSAHLQPERVAKVGEAVRHPPDGAAKPSPYTGREAVKNDSVPDRYRALCLIEITNFLILRRHLGRKAAERLIHDVISGLAGGDVRASAVGRATGEMSFECAAPDHASEMIERL